MCDLARLTASLFSVPSHSLTSVPSFVFRVVLLFGLGATLSTAAVSDNPPWQELIEQNRRLQEQVRAQQTMIDELGAKMAAVLQTTERQERELRGLQGGSGIAPEPARVRDRTHEVRIAAEAGLAFFHTGPEGQFPKGEFRVDDPVISFEAPIHKNVYFFGALKLLPREARLENFQLGELYVDFEDVSSTWGQMGLVNVRVGRFNVPFGEEYLARGPVTNALISHSLSDIWGEDEGAEIYGKLGSFDYTVAVQNGGLSGVRDFNADKALVGRAGWNAATWLRVSGSAMRTGEISTAGDQLSAVWFGNGFFRGLGSPKTTRKFRADLYEADVIARWQTGHLSAAAGAVKFGDNDSTTDNSRRLHYNFVELMQAVGARPYFAARYSSIRVPRGYPLTGWGEAGEYFFEPTLTEELHRLSLGLGYRLGPSLVLKMEYSWENGREMTGDRRDEENFFGTEIGLKF